MPKFMITTIKGGILFLFPLVIIVAVLGKALSIIHMLATPLLESLPIETIAGVAVIHIVSVAVLLLVCFVAGMLAGKTVVSEWVSALERDVLMQFPPYALLKTKTGSVLDPQDTSKLTPVLVRFDDSWQFAYQIEDVGEGRQLVFLPGAPDAWAGSVCAVEEERLSPLATNAKSIGAAMQRLGKGSAEILSQLDKG